MFDKIKYILNLLFGYVFIYPFSSLFKRTKNIWIFGSGNGFFIDNSKYFYLWCLVHGDKNIRYIWFSKNKKDYENMRLNGYDVIYHRSFEAFSLRLRASVFIFSSYVSDIGFFFSKNVIKVNLWHGVGIKKIEFQICEGSLKKIYNKSIINRFLRPHIYSKPDIFLATSLPMKKHFSSAFEISDDRLLISSYPRLNFSSSILLSEEVLRVQKYDDFLNKCKNNYLKLVLYAPTFRDEKNKINPFSLMSDSELIDFNRRMFEGGILFCVKTHFNDSFNRSLNHSNIVIWDNKYDLYPYIREFDILVTDYSSILYDFIFMGNFNIIMFPYDYEDYISNSRSFTQDYFEFVPDNLVFNISDLIEAICSESNFNDVKKLLKIKKYFWSDNCGGNDLIFEAIRDKLQ